MWDQRGIMLLATGVRPWIAAAVAMRLAVMATYVGQALLMAGILAGLLRGAGIREQLIPLGIVAALVLTRFALLWGSEIVAQATSAATKARLRLALFEKLAELGPGYTGGARTGDVQAALVEGVEALESYFGLYLPALVSAILTPAAALIILAPLLMPIANSLGIDSIHYGIVILLSMGIGIFIPPIGICFYIACAVSEAKVEAASKAMMPYLAVLILGVLAVAFVPWFTHAIPNLVGAR